MKKFVLFFLFIPFLNHAQENNHEVNWRSNFIFEANSLNKQFLDALLYGEYINDSTKTGWLNLSKQSNIMYAKISNGIEYSYNFKNKFITFSASDINYLNANIRKDLIKLILKGNYDYQNETLNFSNSNIRADRYQQYKLTYGIKGNKISASAGIAYLVGNHHLSYIINEGFLFTAPQGTYLDIAYDISSFITDTSDLSALTKNGNGLALDFSTTFNINNLKFNLSLEDLGFIMWNTSSAALSVDSSFNFQGIEIDNIYNFNDSLIDANNVIDNITPSNNKSFKSYIPATLHLSLTGKSNYKYLKNFCTGMIAKWQPYMDNKKLSFDKVHQGFIESNYMPLFYITSIIKNKNFDLLPSFSYGGFTKEENIGLAISKGNKNKLIVGTNHLEDLFKGEEAQALSLFINIKLQF